MYADPFDPAEELPADYLTDAQRSLVATAADDGATEVTTYAGTSPVRGGVFVALDGVYYRTDVTVTASTSVPARLLDPWEKGQRAPAGTTAVE